MKYVAPQRGLKAFVCPYCGVLARQYHQAAPPTLNGNYQYNDEWPIATTTCEHCERFALWAGKTMVFPNRGAAPPPNPDMPRSVAACYEEAAEVVSRSPRGAAALLRLAVQLLCKELGEPGHNINSDIAGLVKKGLPPTVQQSLDVVRVVGNNAVHPGQIDVDDAEVAGSLFGLINVIVEYMISMPAKVKGLYSKLPGDARAAIAKRDGSGPSSALQDLGAGERRSGARGSRSKTLGAQEAWHGVSYASPQR